MATASLIPSKGKVTAFKDGLVVFGPVGTSYEMHLVCPTFAGPMDEPIKGTIHIRPRKILTVPSGGLFVTPIFGSPRIVQGRIRWIEEQQMGIHAGAEFVVDLPMDENIYDLANGPLAVGAIANVTAFPGTTFELVK